MKRAFFKHNHEYKVFNEKLKCETKEIFIKTHCRNLSKSFSLNQKENLFNNIKDMYKKIEKELYNNNKYRNEINEIRDLYFNILLENKKKII